MVAHGFIALVSSFLLRCRPLKQTSSIVSIAVLPREGIFIRGECCRVMRLFYRDGTAIQSPEYSDYPWRVEISNMYATEWQQLGSSG